MFKIIAIILIGLLFVCSCFRMYSAIPRVKNKQLFFWQNYAPEFLNESN